MKKVAVMSAVLSALVFGVISPVLAQDAGGTDIPIPKINIDLEEAESPQEVALSLQIIFLITIISLAPTILILMTSFIRIYIVFSFVSRGLATQTIPPNNIVIGLSLFITLFVMFPVLSDSYTEGIKPYMDGEVDINEGFELASAPIRDFMFEQTAERYIYRFIQLANLDRPANPDEVPTYVLIPAFVLNELTLAFYMGMLILVPFTVIDIVVASTLMSMGMMMLPPIMISFPLKIVLFVLVDGWDLLVEKLVMSFS